MIADDESSRHDPPIGPVAPGWTVRRAPAHRTDREATRVALLVGANLRTRRIGRGLNQAQLGAAVGRDHSSVSRWESGERLPALPVLLALARALGCAPTALLPPEFTAGAATQPEDRWGTRGERS